MIGRALPRPLPGGAMAFDLDGSGVLTLLPSTIGWLVRTEGPPPPVPFAGLAFLAGGATLPPEDALVARAPRRTPEAARATFLRSAGTPVLRRLGRLLLSLPEDEGPARLLVSSRGSVPSYVLAHGRRATPLREIPAKDPDAPQALLLRLRVPLVLPGQDGTGRLRLLPLDRLAFDLPRTAHARLALRQALGL